MSKDRQCTETIAMLTAQLSTPPIPGLGRLWSVGWEQSAVCPSRINTLINNNTSDRPTIAMTKTKTPPVETTARPRPTMGPSTYNRYDGLPKRRYPSRCRGLYSSLRLLVPTAVLGVTAQGNPH